MLKTLASLDIVTTELGYMFMVTYTLGQKWMADLASHGNQPGTSVLFLPGCWSKKPPRFRN